MSPTIPGEVFSFFSSSPIGLVITVPREAANPRSPIHESLEAFLCGIPSDEVAATFADKQFQFFTGGAEDLDRAARIWMARQILAEEIPRRRLQVLREDAKMCRPRPYGVEAVADVEVDDDHLVALSEFEFDGSRLTRNGNSFLVLTTTGSPNSTYWLLQAIYDQGLDDRTRVRLDPFLFGPTATFPAIVYMMWIHGRPLDWLRIASLRNPDYGQWRPSPLSRKSEFTDFVWTPRDSEVHFVCEEVPTVAAVDYEAARYFHAVYHRESQEIRHFDGAMRLYTSVEVGERQKLHVRDAGKAGLREKVFRTEGAVPAESLSVIAQSFFVWNEDVRTYFDRDLLSGSTA